VHTGEDLPEVASGRDEHAHTLAGHRHDADHVLRVRLQPPMPPHRETIRSGIPETLTHTNPIEGRGAMRPYLGLRAADEVDGVGLRLESRRRVVAVPHPLRVVYANHRRLWGGNKGLVRDRSQPR
jgi:hypothetical protein